MINQFRNFDPKMINLFSKIYPLLSKINYYLEINDYSHLHIFMPIHIQLPFLPLLSSSYSLLDIPFPPHHSLRPLHPGSRRPCLIDLHRLGKEQIPLIFLQDFYCISYELNSIH